MIKASIGQRRWYFIKSTFNLKFMLLLFAIMIAGVTALGSGLYVLSSNELDVKLFEAHTRIMTSWEILSPTIFVSIFWVFVLMSIITLIIIIVLSKKIAEPLYKFEMIAGEIGKGNFKTNVRLRKKDKVIHLQNAIENMLYGLNGKVKNFKRNYLKIKKIEDDLINAVDTSSLPDKDKTKLSKSLKSLITEYESSLNVFSLREIELAKLQGPYICPVHKWIGVCPEYDEAKERENIRNEQIEQIEQKKNESAGLN